jgi:serine/threonine-protein kinase RsbT
MGMGLPGARRLMDDFDIVSEVGKGTTISMTKWEY